LREERQKLKDVKHWCARRSRNAARSTRPSCKRSSTMCPHR
jgi:hypothetical protein